MQTSVLNKDTMNANIFTNQSDLYWLYNLLHKTNEL